MTIEEDGPLLLIGVNRPDAHNLWNLELIQAVCRACKRLADASRAGLVNEVVPEGRRFDRAIEIARLIAANAPLAVRAAFASARAAERASRDAAAQALLDWNQTVLGSRDAAEGVSAFLERRDPKFEGR